MRVRFLQVAESDAHGLPFVPGQVITIASLTERMSRHVAQGLAEIVRDVDGPVDVAVAPTPERAASTGKRGRHRVRVHA